MSATSESSACRSTGRRSSSPTTTPSSTSTSLPLVRVRLNAADRRGHRRRPRAGAHPARGARRAARGPRRPAGDQGRHRRGEGRPQRCGLRAAGRAPCARSGFVPQAGSDPLLCVKTVTAPCPEGSTADPAPAAPASSSGRSPAPCPTGSTADPEPQRGLHPARAVTTGQLPHRDQSRSRHEQLCADPRQTVSRGRHAPIPPTRVCVVTNTNNIGSGENGRVGSPTGPVATCGRLTMRFVRGSRNLGSSHTIRFGNRTVTRGRLVTCGSNPRPIIGARVDVVHVLPGNKRRRKTGLRSRANGLLTLILPIDLRTPQDRVRLPAGPALHARHLAPDAEPDREEPRGPHPALAADKRVRRTAGPPYSRARSRAARRRRLRRRSSAAAAGATSPGRWR